MKFFNVEKKRVCYLPENHSEIIEYFNDNEDAILIVDFDEFTLNDIVVDFDKISEINLKRIMLSGSYNNINKLNVFLILPNLIEIDNRDVELVYDFKNFPNLEILRYIWRKDCLNFSECDKLKELSLWNYRSTSQDLKDFSRMLLLKDLRIIQSNIRSIKGIENLQELETVVFVANKLLSFDDIETVFYEVKVLHIESCKEINIEKVIEIFPNVEELTFFSNNELKSLRVILDNLKSLTKLNVYNLKILESDNTYWKDYIKLKSFNFQDRKHHILKRKDFENVD